MIARSNQMFVRVAEIGECDAKGKTVLGFQFKGKQVGEPDRHLSTVVLPFMFEILKMAHWSSDEARDKDLADFLAYVEDLRKSDEARDKDLADFLAYVEDLRKHAESEAEPDA